MKTFCINLEQAIDRRRLIESKLSYFGDVEFFKAATPKNLPDNFINLYKKDEASKIFGVTQSAPELSCFYNHFLLWKKCIELDEPILILEDNFSIVDEVDLADAISLINNEINQFGLIKLADNKDKKNNVTAKKSENFDIVHKQRASQGTSGYAISPTIARKLVDEINHDGFFQPVDDHIERSWQRGFPIYSIQKNPIYRDRSIDSLINGERKKKKRKKGKINSAFKRKNKIMRSFFNMRIFFYIKLNIYKRLIKQ